MNSVRIRQTTAGLACVFLLGGCAAQERSALHWQERSAQTARSRLASAQPKPAEPHRADPVSSYGEDHGLAACYEPPSFSLAAEHSPQIEDARSNSQSAADGDETNSKQPGETAEEQTVERGPLPGFRETLKRDLHDIPREMWEDTKAAFGNPWNVLLLATAGGASIALETTNADDSIDDHFTKTKVYNDFWADAFGGMGNPITHLALAGGWYVAGQQLQDAKTYEVGRKLISALTITGVTSMALKVATWRDGPNDEWGAWPSGHVSSTMALATVLNGAYGPVVGVPMFGLTALVGLERLDSREHWMSDVVFGAVLGWVVGETVFKEHRPEILGGEVVPYVDPVRGGAGIAWLKPLGVDAPKLKSH